MTRTLRILAALAVGAVVFLGTLVGLTEALAPFIWLSVLVSLPMAIVAAVFVAGLTFGLLQYRTERARDGRASDRTVTALVSLVVGTLAAVLGGAAAVLLAESALALGLVAAMLVVGLPAGLLVGLAAVAATVTVRDRRRRGRSGPTA